MLLKWLLILHPLPLTGLDAEVASQLAEQDCQALADLSHLHNYVHHAEYAYKDHLPGPNPALLNPLLQLMVSC